MENNKETIDVDDIMHKIRMEIARRKAEIQKTDNNNDNGIHAGERIVSIQMRKETQIWQIIKKIQYTLAKYPLYPLLYRTAFRFKELIPRYNEYILLDELLKYDDDKFIRNAYRLILNREPDHDGYEYYLHLLRRSPSNKINIISSLRFSQEGKKLNIRIHGLLVRSLKYRASRIRVFSYFFRLAASILSLPRILHNFREYETFTQARFNKNERLLNLLSSDFEKKLHEINQNISVKADNLIVDNLKSQLLSKADVRETNDIKVLASSKADLRIVEGISNELKVIITQIKDCKANILDHQHRLARLLEEVRKSLPGPISASQVENMLKEENHLLDMMYAAFEDHFRGPKDDIKERLRIYIPYLEQLPNVKNSHMLDIGCGRGEWLELLKEYGYIARGVDCNTAMIQRCIKLDLDVIQADALAFLAEQKENNYSVLTGFHIVEHLPLKDMISFFDESLRVLKPGGIMIIESPNPQNILVGSCNFYLDPTHRNPLPPAAAKFFIETRGFSSVEVLTLHPYPASYRLSGSALAERFNDYFYSAQDYAVIGYKT